MEDYYLNLIPIFVTIFLWWGTGRLPLRWKFAISICIPVLLVTMLALGNAHFYAHPIASFVLIAGPVAALSGIGALLACGIEYAWKALRNRP